MKTFDNTHILVRIADIEKIEETDTKNSESHIVAHLHKTAPKIDLSPEMATSDANCFIEELGFLDPEEKAWWILGFEAAYARLNNLK